MVYKTEASKWRAYQFSDPFAAGSFVVCNKINTKFCRPDCDAHPVTELRPEIKFVSSAVDASKLGYSPCESCNPTEVPSINVNLLLKTVKDINASIGFVQPLLDDDDDKVHETIKENIIGQGSDQRRMSLPSNTYKPAKSVAYSVSKNDSEHYRLIDLACRHLALAAANSIFSAPSQPNSPSSGASSPKEESGGKKKGRKRRGGVLGFKELATKSKLSAWHFHRVFKSIIGLTPKTYGDMCWEYLEKERDSMMSPTVGPSSAGSEDLVHVSLAQQMSPPVAVSKKRSVEIDEIDAASPKRATFSEFSFKDDEKDFAFTSRATSEPNLANIYSDPGSRLAHFPSFGTTETPEPKEAYQESDNQDFRSYNQYPTAMPQVNMAPNDFQLPSFGLEEDFSSVNITPTSANQGSSPSDIEQLGLGYDDAALSMFFTPQQYVGPLDHYMAPELQEVSLFDDKKPLDLEADPMFAGINDMLVASGY